MNKYEVTLGVSVRAYKTVTISAKGLLDLMRKARGIMDEEDFTEGWEVEFSSAFDDTLTDVFLNGMLVIEEVDLTDPDEFPRIAKKLGAENDQQI